MSNSNIILSKKIASALTRQDLSAETKLVMLYVSITGNTRPRGISRALALPREIVTVSLQVLDEDSILIATKPKNIPEAPHQRIIELYNKHAKGTGLVMAQGLNDARKKAIRAIWKSIWAGEFGDRPKDVEGAMSFLDALFAKAATSMFLCGKTGNKWRAGFDFVIKPPKAARIIEGFYHEDGFDDILREVEDYDLDE